MPRLSFCRRRGFICHRPSARRFPSSAPRRGHNGGLRLVSPAALIVTASAGICGFTLPSRDLSDAVRIWRFALAILAGAGGLFALTAGGIALLIHLSGLTSLDVSYLAPFSDARARRAVLRPLLVRQKWRDTALHPQDLKNQGDGHAQ
ncbi:MAG: spore germination protein [Oscillospiraceae bacterium]